MSDVAMVAQGDVLGDRYVLRRHVWTSSIGPVWLAKDRTLDRQVFVQLLSDELNAAAARTFQKAAARGAQITHPSLLQIFDIGEEPALAVSDNAGRRMLSARLARGRPMAVHDAARVTLALARGLEAMHERSAWHGSLSPSNVLF